MHKRSLFICSSLIGLTVGILPCSPLAKAEPIKTLSTQPSDPAHLMALQNWLSERNCLLKVIDSKSQSADFVFEIHDTENTKTIEPPVLKAKTRGELPLKATWLIKSSTGIKNVSSLKGERVAIMDRHSLLGYQEPIKLLEQAGVAPNDVTPLFNSQYQGALVLLLHGDVFAASAPLPLAQPWASANELTIIAESNNIFTAGIWSRNNSTLSESCMLAFKTLKKESYRDAKMKAFPEWLAGFTVPN